MTKLTQKQKDAFPSSYFAVPETKQLPINDEIHVDMAWRMINKTGGLSDEQRSRAKNRILRRAHKLGMSTDQWHARAEPKLEAADYQKMRADALANPDADEMQDFNVSNPADSKDFAQDSSNDEKEHHELDEKCVMSFSAMAIEMPAGTDEAKEHPNKVPFTGILTRLDQPSDLPLSTGSNGRCVVLPKSVAEKALSTLMCMAVDFRDDLSGHDPQQKIGIITGATIEGNAIHIEGFFYGADFPNEVKRIQANKSRLGFSYEAQVLAKPMGDDLLEIIECAFTGAAVLYKDKAAYTSTSLSANAEEENKMSKEILDALAVLNQRFENVEKQMKEVQASGNQTMMDKVRPHMEACHAAADAMCAAGFGAHPEHGHAALMRKIGNHMMASAAMGVTPHVFTDHNFLAGTGMSASAAAPENEAVKKLQDEISVLKTKLDDAEKARFEAAANPQRKTLTPEIRQLLANNNINEANKEKIAIETVDEAFKAKGLNMKQRFAQKILMNANGMIQSDAGVQ